MISMNAFEHLPCKNDMRPFAVAPCFWKVLLSNCGMLHTLGSTCTILPTCICFASVSLMVVANQQLQLRARLPRQTPSIWQRHGKQVASNLSLCRFLPMRAQQLLKFRATSRLPRGSWKPRLNSSMRNKLHDQMPDSLVKLHKISGA